MMRYLLPRLFLVCLGMALFSSCDEDKNSPQLFGQLTGAISNEIGMRIQDASIEVKNSNFKRTVQTNEDGQYFFDQVPVGEYELSISAASYISSTISATIAENKVNETNVVLQLGTAELEVNPKDLRIGISEGLMEIAVTSNTSWKATTQVSWISFSSAEGQGNRSLSFIFQENPTEDIREAQIEIRAGDISRTVKVTQDKPVRLLEVTPIFGENVSQKRASFDLTFSGPVTIVEIRPLISWCLPSEYTPFTMNSSRTKVSYTYTCAQAGGSYPFIIQYKDDRQNVYVENIDVEYFDKTLSYDGFVIAKALVPGKDKVWMLTENPARAHLIDLKELKLEQSISLTNPRPSSITYNPSNQLLYIGTLDGKILIYQPNSGQLKETIALPAVPFQPYENYYINEMAFTTAGKAIVRLYQAASSAITWMVMDSKQNHAISDHATKGWDAGQLHEIQFLRTVDGDKNVYFYGLSSDNRGLMKMDEHLNGLSMIVSGENDPKVLGLSVDRKIDRFIFFDGGVYIVDKGQRTTLGYIDISWFNADFCRSCTGDKTVLIAGIETPVLAFYDYGQSRAIKRFPTGGGSWRQFYHTLDGKEIIFESGNYDYADATESFSGKLIQIDMKRFNP